MSSASSTVTYTSVDTDSKPGRAFWTADEELSDGGFPQVIVYGYDGLPIQREQSSPTLTGLNTGKRIQHAHDPNLIQVYVAGLDPEEDSEEEHADYPADGGDDDDDDDDNDDDIDDEDEEPFEEEEEEEEHLAPADPSDVHVPSAEDTGPIEAVALPKPPSPPAYTYTANRYIFPTRHRLLLLPKEEVERLLALPTSPPSPLISLSPPFIEERLARCLAAPALPSSPLPRLPHPYAFPLPSPPLPPLPSSPLPPLPDSLFIPPVDRRDDIPEAELPSHKRLCLTTPHRDMSQMTEKQKTVAIGSEILGSPKEIPRRRLLFPVAGEQLYGSREAWAHSMGLSSAVHYELQGYRTHTWRQDHRINAQESQIAALTVQNNMPPKRTSAATKTARAAAATAAAAAATTATATAAAAPMTTAAVE
ncbi:hypothetical protein Tco_1415626 [Tanacetum coccineum]